MDKEQQKRINETLRKYESQRGGPCIPNHIVLNEHNGDEHELVKFWICRAIQTGKHLIGHATYGKPVYGTSYELASIDEIRELTKEPRNHFRIVWENDHAGECLSFITEAMQKEGNFWVKLYDHIETKGTNEKMTLEYRRVDVVRLEFPLEIEIMDKNVKMKICDYGFCQGGKIYAHGVYQQLCPKCHGKVKVPDYPDGVDVVVILNG